MKAKDTVIETKDHSMGIGCPHCGEEFGVETLTECLREEQAEISFRAGVKEVVGWIEGSNDIDASYFTRKAWVAKLKEWGIK